MNDAPLLEEVMGLSITNYNKGGIMKKQPKSKFYKGYLLNYCWCGYPEMRWMVYWAYPRWLATFKRLDQAKKWINEKISAMAANTKRTGRACPHYVEYNRPPTKGEIAFGYGVTHYREIPTEWVIKPGGKFKKWMKHHGDKLRYYQ